MKIGDLVTVLYERKRFYIIVEEASRLPAGEARYRLLCLDDGSHRYVPYSEIKIINKAENK
jgi:hypothetical protein